MNKARILWELYSFPHFVYDDPKHIAALQKKRLRKLLFHCWDHSDWYRDTWQQAGMTRERLTEAPLSALPVIDKKQLMDNYDRIVTDPHLTQERLRTFAEKENSALYRGRYHVIHSSGSTDVPHYFAYDRHAWEAAQCGIIRGAMFGMPFHEILKLIRGGVRVLYIAATDGRYAGSTAIGKGVEHLGGASLYLDIGTPLEEWPAKIQAFRPNVIIGYPSAVKLAGSLMREGAVRMECKRVITCGEPLPSALRVWLEECFGARVVNFYGASESLCIGAADDDSGLVLYDDLNVVEVVDGEMVLTSLTNFSQPLVRYHMTDRLTLREKNGPRTMADVLLGREEDMLWFVSPSGRREFLHPLAVEGFCVAGLLDYRFVQTGRDSFVMEAETVSACCEESIQRKMKESLQRLLDEKRLDWVRFEIRFVGHIPADQATGKKKLIVPGPC